MFLKGTQYGYRYTVIAADNNRIRTSLQYSTYRRLGNAIVAFHIGRVCRHVATIGHLARLVDTEAVVETPPVEATAETDTTDT